MKHLYDWIRKLGLSKTQMAVVLASFYIFFSLAANIAASKVTYFGALVMDAGIIYAFTFTWRDLIHKQLGKRTAIITILVSAIINLLAALYFQFVLLLPAESEWASAGGQSAWEFIFGLQLRIVIGSIITMVIAELIDTLVYHYWTKGIGKKLPQFLRVFVSNGVSVPVDSILFPIIAFIGVLGWDIIFQMFLTNIAIKYIITLVSFWMIYLVPEKPLYVHND